MRELDAFPVSPVKEEVPEVHAGGLVPRIRSRVELVWWTGESLRTQENRVSRDSPGLGPMGL